MGTNFYFQVIPVAADLPREIRGVLPDGSEAVGRVMWERTDGDTLRTHIGKRSAAGMYCWDCRVTLCVGGESRIHYGDDDFHKACPRCGATRTATDDAFKRGPAAVELGFAKPETAPPRGVDGCASFSWAIEPAFVRRVCEARMGDTIIVNEYGDTMTGGEFLQMLKCNCPVEFTHHIGIEFS